jgi:hypothetical protein
MRSSRQLRFVALAVALGACAPPSSEPPPRVVRAFAVGNHLDLAASESHATFQALKAPAARVQSRRADLGPRRGCRAPLAAGSLMVS